MSMAFSLTHTGSPFVSHAESQTIVVPSRGFRFGEVQEEAESSLHHIKPLNDIDINEILDSSTNSSTIASILKRCGRFKSLSAGKLVHSYIKEHHLEKNRFLGNCLIDMYGNCGTVKDAYEVFYNLPSYNTHSWNIMINAYAKNGYTEEALAVYHKMMKEGFEPDFCTFSSILNVCSSVEMLQVVHDIHCTIIDQGYGVDTEVSNALITVYGRCRHLSDAEIVFCRMIHQNVVSWNALIAACIQNERCKEGLDAFWMMNLSGYEPDKITFTSTLHACLDTKNLVEGENIHALIIDAGCLNDTTLMTALVNMYGKCGSFDSAKVIFLQIFQPDMICWNTFISACNNNNHWEMALDSSSRMQGEGFHPNEFTFAYMLEACANLALLGKGQEIHAEIIETGREMDLVLCTALLNMYGKCGALSDAMDVFNEMDFQDVVAWTAIITACAQNGRSKEALFLFHEMQENGLKPDETSFLSVLSACNHAGWVDVGKYHFISMLKNHNILYKIEHFTCMVDLLGRAGHIEDAEYLTCTIVNKEKAAAWLSLLGSCIIHGDESKAFQAANHVFEVDADIATSYVMLSNVIYSTGNTIFEEMKVEW